MNFNTHSNLRDKHAFLGASKYHWLNYDDEKIAQSWYSFQAIQKGTIEHAFAAQAITLGHKLKREKKTLDLYVNDAIGFKMQPEQILYFSDNCFGTADAISFRNTELRIHDLKTGSVPAHMEQLMIYAALFCLEYGYKPSEIKIELRIYQNDQVLVDNPKAEDIEWIMERIRIADRIIEETKAEG